MADALTWLLAVELLGLLGYPLAFVLFHRLPDRGLTLAKPLAMVLFSYVLWAAGLTHLVPNTLAAIIVILLLAAVAGGLVLRSAAGRLRVFLREEWKTLLVAEAVFLAFFLLWLSITSEAPAINHTEKPMDFGFMNAVLQSRYFPPEDPWLSGHSISYYYFGHFMMAFLAKLTAVPSSVAYNLAVSLVPALLGIGAFGLLYNLVRLSGGSRAAAVGFGLAAPALVILIGNLEGALEFVYARGWGGDGFWGWVGIKGLEGGAAASSGVFPDQFMWWWRATRVIDTLSGGQSLDYTITEFPMFSFLLGDLHPHVVSLPFVVLGLSLGLNLFQSPDRLGPGWLRRHPLESVGVAFFVGSLAFINTWDFPLMAGVLAVLLLVKGIRETGGDLQRAAVNTASVLAPILVVAVALFIPFYMTLGSQASGILPLRDVSTRPFLFFLVMGLFSVLAVSFLLRQLPGLTRPRRDEAPTAALAVVAAVAPLVVWAAVVLPLTFLDDGAMAAVTRVGGRTLWVLPGLAVVAVAWFSAAQRARLGREPVVAFPLLLLAAGFYLLIGAELFYVVDAFGGGLKRMNTVFKVYYQAWLLLGLAGAYALYYWRSHRPAARSDSGRAGRNLRLQRLGRYTWAGAIAVLLVASSYYPVGAVLDRTGWLSRDHTLDDNTLDGLRFLKAEDPGEYFAIRWLRDEAPWGRMVEAVGDDYSDYGRVSSSTGLPTVLGWKGHELQWRGTSRPFAGREEDVARIYGSDDEDEVRGLLEWYDVRYVYVGRRERAAYGAGHLAGFEKSLRTAFRYDGVTVYELMDGAGDGGTNRVE